MSIRERVKGDGPDRSLLKVFYKLGTVSPKTIEELNTILDTFTHSDIGTDMYSITNTIDYEKTHGVADSYYRQVLLQNSINQPGMKSAVVGQTFKEKEELYTQWATNIYTLDSTIKDVNTFFKQVYRFRLSETQPHHSIAWHIDTNTSVMCRAQICIKEDDSLFEFKDREGTHRLHMKQGDLWFINTGWNHRVVANTQKRRTAILSFKFSDLLTFNEVFR